ncbi:RING-type domain-containing protein [Caerostris extrusa]|uniref:RING-type domain-containing protein n=1 Tax=Caerostris extrusa TaxID=172846 RepID=A0AAV4QBI7_CAEEX|nr:RING-type domain-containing protein [Caerostris extrusa]
MLFLLQDKLLVRLEEHEPEQAQTQDEECAICISAKATMQTFPCGHRVVCRKCFVKTIQMAVSQRLLPLRCVICRAKILRLKQLSPSNKNNNSSSSHHQQQQDPNSNHSPFANSSGQRHIRSRPLYLDHTSILYPPSSSSHRRSNLRQRMAFRPPNLLSIPESEELDLVNAVRDREVLCPDLENKWSRRRS